MTLSEVDGVMQHMQLWKWLRMCFRLPVLMNVAHHAAPCVDIGRCPVARAKQAMMQLLQPAGEDGVGGLRCCWDIGSSCEECGAAFPLDPLADLRPVEVVQVSSAAAASGVHGGDALQRCFDALFAQQFAECIEDDAIANAKEEVERSRHDVLRRDREERRMSAINGMFVCRSAITRRVEEIVLADNANGTRVSGRWSHEAEHSINKAPVTVEEGAFGVDEILQHSPDVWEGSRFAFEWCQSFRTAILQLQPTVAALVDQQRSKVLPPCSRVCDAQHASAASGVTADCYEGGLRIQDRHVSERVSNVGTARKRACLCGM